MPRHAADTLNHLGSPDADDAAPALAAAVADPDEAVRLAALNALGQLLLPSAWAVIDEAAGSAEHLLRVLVDLAHVQGFGHAGGPMRPLAAQVFEYFRV